MIFQNIPVISWDIYDDVYDNANANTNAVVNYEKNISHIIQIPNNMMDDFLTKHTTTHPLVIKIKTMTNEICFGNIEISNDNMVVMPHWALHKLNIDVFSMVSIEPVELVSIGKIMLKAIDSKYVYWDKLREQLEERFSQFYAINKGDCIHCLNTEFYVIGLYDNDNMELMSGSLFETDVKIEFETPTDIEEEERIHTIKKLEKEKILLEEYNKKKELQQKKEEEENIVSKGRRLGGNPISREESIRRIEERFKKTKPI